MPYKLTKIGSKLLVSFLVLSIIPFTLIGIAFFVYSDKSLSKTAFDQLRSIRQVKKAQMEDFFVNQTKNIGFLVETVSSLEQAAFAKLNTVQENKKAQIKEYLKKSFSDIHVISKNSTVIRALSDFSSAIDTHGVFDQELYYFFEQTKYGESLKQFKEEYGYDDILIVNASGWVVFSLNRESDLGQNLLTGDLKDSGLAMCFRQAQKGIHIQDFELYPSSNGEFVAFLGAPVAGSYQDVSGVVILKIRNNAINTIVQRRQGMGKSGESFIVGDIKAIPTYRTDRIIQKAHIGEIREDDDIAKAIYNAYGPVVKTGSTGEMVIARYDPLRMPGLDWSVVTTMNLEEVIAPKMSTDEDYFSQYIKVYGFSDLLLLTPTGDVFYSVAHNDDYGTNVLIGSYANSSLGRIFKKVIKSQSFEFIDFKPYAPLFGKPSAFMAQPVLLEGHIELVVVLRMPVDTINRIMQERTGFGKTCETYLVGPDYLLRSNSHLDPEAYSIQASFASPDTRKIDTPASREALSGKTGQTIMINYLGDTVLSAYTPLKAGDSTWALIADISRKEAFSSLTVLKVLAIVLIFISISLMAIASLFKARQFATPIALLTKGAEQVKARNFDITVDVKTNDELELLSDAFNAMVNEIRVYAGELEQKVDMLEKAESELRKSNTLLNAVMEGTTDAIYVKDLDGRYLMANATICNLLDKPVDALIGKNPDDLFLPDTARVINLSDIQVLKTGASVQTEQKIATHQGESYWLANKSPYLDNDGNIIGLFGISRDITRQKLSEKEKEELEAKLRQSHKMEAVGTLAGGIAHDFNNILAAILGYSELIHDKLADDSTEKQYVKDVMRAGHRAKNLVKQILAFSRKAEQSRTPIEFRKLLKEALQLLRASIPTTIDIQTMIADNCGKILGDPTQIHQVIMNICTNAAQAMDESGGTMRITLDCRELSKAAMANEPHLKAGLYVRFSVQDTGSGIEKEIKDRIFDPYFTTKEIGKGSGMGLAVVHGIVKNHEGVITVESTPLKGTTFNVYFPVLEAPVLTETENQGPIPRGTERIMVVDDEVTMADITKRRLEILGYEVEAVVDSIEALEMFKARPQAFDLVITDQTMPKMTGENLAGKMLALNKDTRIILCTGYSSKMDSTSAREAGISAFLMKPVETRDLAVTIRQVLDKKG